MSANVVGRTITKLGIRGNIDGVARAIINKAAHSERTVTSYLYSPKGVKMIEAAFLDGESLVQNWARDTFSN